MTPMQKTVPTSCQRQSRLLAHALGTYRVGRIAALLQKVDTNIAADATSR